MATPLKLVFAGTPEFAARHLDVLIDGPHSLAAVLTQPDRPAGRGKRLLPSPVKQRAERASVPVWQPDSLRDPAVQAELATLQIDALIVVAYGLILPPEVLALPRLGCVNVHASLLPRWRGAAPIQRAIEAGDAETGVCLMLMDQGLDTGPVLMRRSLAIAEDHTAGSLTDALATLGQAVLADGLRDLPALLEEPQQQPDAGITYAHKIDKAEACIDWSQPADVLARRIKAFDPMPGCYTWLQTDRFKIWQASASQISHQHQPGEIVRASADGLEIACGEGVIRVTRAQIQGSPAQAIGDILNGHLSRLQVGSRFAAQAPH